MWTSSLGCLVADLVTTVIVVPIICCPHINELVQTASMNLILADPLSNSNITYPKATFINDNNRIVANETYIFEMGDVNNPSRFLYAIMKLIGLVTTPPPTTTAPGLLPTLYMTLPSSGTTAGLGNQRFPTWALAIIIPCAIAIILIPLWILLCCFLFGCCAAIRRHFSRRRSYHINRTHYDIF
ncbi:uncharacterized protein LOC125705273 isoform X2 [Brienomyrus brachyistius]|uniref:uncharacterized protein LOC125705273 isoform X2 n=1 Tax=Brienomyrus brachyistius TaxID=42636 RepID=UPI0020B28DB8|nr:uncharacterized protein LOC125705273 isoform X2 [Brienomyrus brachyistius]